MHDFDEDDLGALEARMREILKPEAARTTGGLTKADIAIAHKLAEGLERKNPLGLSEQSLMMATKLVGRENVERLGRAQPGRRVRVKPMIVTVDWYVVPGDRPGDPAIWHYDKIVNGRRDPESHAYGVDMNDLNQRLADFRRRNIVCRKIALEGERHEPTKPVGHRKSFAERFGKVGGNGR